MKRILLFSFIFLLCHCAKKSEGDKRDTGIEAKLLDSAAISIAAELHYKSNRFHESLIEYEKLLRIDSTNGKYLFRKAYCLMQLDFPSDAIRNYEIAAGLNYRQFDCFYSIGLNALILKNDSLAILYFEKCLLLKPNSSEVKTFLEHLKSSDKAFSL